MERETDTAPALAGLTGNDVALQAGNSVTANETYIRESAIKPDAKVVERRSNFMANWVFSGEHYININYRIRSWLLTFDQKRIVLLYLVSISLFFYLGGAFAVPIRLELLTPQDDLVEA